MKNMNKELILKLIEKITPEKHKQIKYEVAMQVLKYGCRIGYGRAIDQMINSLDRLLTLTKKLQNRVDKGRY